MQHRSVCLRRDPHPARARQGETDPCTGRSPSTWSSDSSTRSATASRTWTRPLRSTTSCSVVGPVGDQGSDIARIAAVAAGLPDTVRPPAYRRTASVPSGPEAVTMAAAKVRFALERTPVLAGGVESMSRVPMASDGGAWFNDPMTNLAVNFVPQGIGADLIATIEGFSRRDVDEYAALSQERAANAWKEGRFERSVVPVEGTAAGSSSSTTTSTCAPGTTADPLARLKPSFADIGELGGFDAVALQKYHWVEKIDHVHHAGNSSGIVDGASLVAIGSKEVGERHGLTPRAAADRLRRSPRLRADHHAHRARPGHPQGPRQGRAGPSTTSTFVEINEALAAVVLRFVRDMGLSLDKVNVNGGAIALGHPLGATPARSSSARSSTNWSARTSATALATARCVGGGMGIANDRRAHLELPQRQQRLLRRTPS
ncbi:acetyl-CoA C-acyltransferase [Streptomyces sp. L7]